MTTQRIPTNTNEAIVEFYNKVLSTDGQRFMPVDLVNFVQPFGFGTTPDTVKRALRTLRQAGKVNYSVVNRAQSIFIALPLEVQASEPSNG
jgi:DNA-binding transcriptional regulator PaaX